MHAGAYEGKERLTQQATVVTSKTTYNSSVRKTTALSYLPNPDKEFQLYVTKTNEKNQNCRSTRQKGSGSGENESDTV